VEKCKKTISEFLTKRKSYGAKKFKIDEKIENFSNTGETCIK